MAHDVFISYSQSDKVAATTACKALEAGGIKCWIAPRDIQPGKSWASSITSAIKQSRALVLMFSPGANDSQNVEREVDLAFKWRIAVITFRLKDAPLSDALQYYLGAPHWVDRSKPGTKKYQPLVDAIAKFLFPVSLFEKPRSARSKGANGRSAVASAVRQSPPAKSTSATRKTSSGTRKVGAKKGKKPNKIDPKRWYSAQEVADLLGLTVQTVLNYCRKGDFLKARKLGPRKRWYILGAELISFRTQWGLSLARGGGDVASKSPKNSVAAAPDKLIAGAVLTVRKKQPSGVPGGPTYFLSFLGLRHGDIIENVYAQHGEPSGKNSYTRTHIILRYPGKGLSIYCNKHTQKVSLISVERQPTAPWEGWVKTQKELRYMGKSQRYITQKFGPPNSSFGLHDVDPDVLDYEFMGFRSRSGIVAFYCPADKGRKCTTIEVHWFY